MNAREFDQKLSALIAEVGSLGDKGPSLPTILGIIEMHQQFLCMAYNQATRQPAKSPPKSDIVPIKVMPNLPPPRPPQS